MSGDELVEIFARLEASDPRLAPTLQAIYDQEGVSLNIVGRAIGRCLFRLVAMGMVLPRCGEDRQMMLTGLVDAIAAGYERDEEETEDAGI